MEGGTHRPSRSPAIHCGKSKGNRLDFNFVKENLASLWKIKGDFSMAIHGEQAFMFKFSLEKG